ncbi:hypothetical protein Chor_008921 [Crotalus horridus]
MSKTSGQKAAKFVINKHPELFEKDYAEPPIQFMVFAFAGTSVSLETSNSLLDLLCFYGDREPDQENDSSLEKQEETPSRRQFARNSSNFQQITWRENNNAERIFHLMPEKNAHSYCTMIRGMVKHGECQKAFNMYADLLNKNLKADVSIFNTLILAAVEVKEKYIEKWACIEDMLRQMAEQDIQPNLLTFNSVLKALKQCGKVPRAKARLILNEMRALNIAGFAESQSHVLYAIINEIERKTFCPQDPDDIHFFPRAMKTCLELKDVQLAYRLHRVLEKADNRIMLGDMTQKNFYYMSFFELLSIMEHLDVLLKWYKELVPSAFYPNIRTMLLLLQALDTGDCLELIPQIWKDIKQFGFSLRDPVVQETQVAFADCAENIKSLHELKSKNMQLLWTDTSLNNTTTLFARAGRTQEAWNMLQLFKKYSQVPSDLTVKEMFNCIKQSSQADKALELLKLTAEYGIQSTSVLAKTILEEFELSEEQKRTLDDIIEGSCG